MREGGRALGLLCGERIREGEGVKGETRCISQDAGKKQANSKD